MFEKDLKIGYLIDFYGEILTERKKEVLDMYFNEDLSLSEISEQIGISRQGVRDIIKKSEEELRFFEEKLGLAGKFLHIEKLSKELLTEAKEQNLKNDFIDKISEIYDISK